MVKKKEEKRRKYDSSVVRADTVFTSLTQKGTCHYVQYCADGLHPLEFCFLRIFLPFFFSSQYTSTYIYFLSFALEFDDDFQKFEEPHVISDFHEGFIAISG